MVLNNKVVLITGGSSGIGLQLAKILIGKGNKVIVCGRSLEKLIQAKQLLPDLVTFQCDLSVRGECEKLAVWIEEAYPELSVLVNNAAIVNRTLFLEDKEAISKAIAEINTNLLAPITLIKLLLPVISKNSNPGIINVTTGLVYAPKASYPFYNSTKSALHSFTQVLREQLSSTPVCIQEVLFPVVDTPWHAGNAHSMAISAEEAVDEMVKKVERGQMEVKVGKVKLLYWLSRISPSIAMKIINKSRS